MYLPPDTSRETGNTHSLVPVATTVIPYIPAAAGLYFWPIPTSVAGIRLYVLSDLFIGISIGMIRPFRRDSNTSRVRNKSREARSAQAIHDGTQSLLSHGWVNTGSSTLPLLYHTGLRQPGSSNRNC